MNPSKNTRGEQRDFLCLSTMRILMSRAILKEGPKKIRVYQETDCIINHTWNVMPEVFAYSDDKTLMRQHTKIIRTDSIDSPDTGITIHWFKVKMLGPRKDGTCWVNCLLGKCEDLSSNPRTHLSPSMWNPGAPAAEWRTVPCCAQQWTRETVLRPEVRTNAWGRPLTSMPAPWAHTLPCTLTCTHTQKIKTGQLACLERWKAVFKKNQNESFK